MSALSVVTADPVTDPRWRRLAGGPGSSLFTSPPWISAVCRSYGFTPEARIALDAAGEPVGGFAWVAVEDVRGRRLSSLPFSDRADPLTAGGPVFTALLDAAKTGEEQLTLRCLADSPAVADPRLRTVGEAAWHGTPLDAGVEEIHRRIASASRRNIRAAERAGVRVEVRDDLDAVHAFHRLHVGLRKHKYRLLAQPREFFENIWHEFRDDGRCVTLLATLDGEVIAGAMFLEWNDVIYYKFGASVPEHLRARPNDAVYWTGIQRGVERGMRLVDWGLSDLDQPGLVGFKRKWASDERRIVTLRSGTWMQAPEQEEFGRELGELTRLLTDPSVPDEITARVGALLYRYFC
ncbi:lipid II:glycine glycyltransferase FemX [Pseudonocardia zijingensis]|uniref:BioF2-like acetyltransferase domain-containing protein n=1 Tax=Pseudonocardia zijingensis TaxID=153376 RepID=A0ABN1NGG3_9PSEU